MIGLIVISLYVLHFGVEATVDVTFEDIDILHIDPEYFDPEKTELFVRENDDGENVLISTIGFVKKIPDDSTAHVSVMGLSMGVYKIPTGIDVTMKICDLVDEPVIMGPLLKAFGFTKDPCPPLPGVYSQDGYIPPMDLMPDTFVENKYQGIFEVFVEKTAVLSVGVYLDVQI